MCAPDQTSLVVRVIFVLPAFGSLGRLVSQAEAEAAAEARLRRERERRGPSSDAGRGSSSLWEFFVVDLVICQVYICLLMRASVCVCERDKLCA